MGEDVETRTQGLDDLSAQWTALKVRRNVSQWRRIGTSQEVLRVISGGVKVRFDGVPRTQQFSGSFLKSETQRKEWREIRKDYLEKGAISIVDNPDKSAHVSRSFLVPKKDEFGNRTGQRLIIDLRPLNAQVLPYPVHYEDFFTSGFIQIIRNSFNSKWMVNVSSARCCRLDSGVRLKFIVI
ncbi:hypothetical protein BSKO_02762 [Bryopsis sp. KO-2023]|nr:hypothetical protein BSKO_02762 [Bryopsis sp. KO-2023]